MYSRFKGRRILLLYHGKPTGPKKETGSDSRRAGIMERVRHRRFLYTVVGGHKVVQVGISTAMTYRGRGVSQVSLHFRMLNVTVYEYERHLEKLMFAATKIAPSAR